MKRSQLLDHLAGRILGIELTHPVRVAIDGPDAAGKTMLAEELKSPLQSQGRPVIPASIDGFHNPAHVRHQRGDTSPEGYYYDSFNYEALIQFLLAPLGKGGSREYRPAVFDYRTDSAVATAGEVAAVNAVLLFDGVFLLRSELVSFWDYSIFVDAGFETTLARAARRDASLFGSVANVKRRYEQRYIPGQKLYYAESRPRDRADVVVDNNDPSNAVVVRDNAGWTETDVGIQPTHGE